METVSKGGGRIFTSKSLIVLLLTLIIVSVLFAVGPGLPFSKGNKSPDKGSKTIEDGEPWALKIPNGGIKDVLPKRWGDMDIKVIKELKSGQVDSLPWEEDADFLQAKEENGTDILMAAYRTVLIDPLPGEEYNVHLAAKMLSGRVINPGRVFSQNQEIGPYDETKGFREGPTYVGTQLITTIGGGVCKISSTLYNVAVLCNLEIVQRYNHSMPVPYVPYGQDATVAYGSRDFQFKNDTSFPILLWAKGIDNTLYIAFYGKEKPPKVEWHHDITGIQKAPILFKQNPALSPGIERKLVEGMDGATVKSRVTITYPDKRVENKNMGTSNYRPMPSIIERRD